MSGQAIEWARYESKARRYGWAAVPIGVGLLGMTLYIVGVWSFVRDVLPAAGLHTSGWFKLLILGWCVCRYGYVVFRLLLLGAHLQRNITPELTPFLRVGLSTVLTGVVVWGVIVGAGLWLLELWTPLSRYTAVLLWSGWLILWSGWLIQKALYSVCESLRAISQQTAEGDGESADSERSVVCAPCAGAGHSEATTPAQADAEERIPVGQFIFLLLVVVGASLLLIALQVYATYKPLAEGGLTVSSILASLGQALFVSAVLVGWGALLYRDALVYRMLARMRDVSSRVALAIDLMALTLALTAFLFCVSLSLALMQG